MRYVEVDGLRTSVIGLGAWQFGSREWGYGEAYATETAPRLVRRALELGITMLDTAEAYGPGRSERIIAGALAAIEPVDRADLIVATKFLPIAPAEPILARQAAGSRRRLGVDVARPLLRPLAEPVRLGAPDDAGAAAAGRRRRRSPRRRQQLRARRLAGCGARARAARSWRTRSASASLSPAPARDLVPYAAGDGPARRRLLAAGAGAPRHGQSCRSRTVPRACGPRTPCSGRGAPARLAPLAGRSPRSRPRTGRRPPRSPSPG